MRRRGAVIAPTEQMDKGAGKNYYNRLCLLVTLSAFFWTLLLYFHFVVLGSNTVRESNQLDIKMVNSESTPAHLTDGHLPEPRKIAMGSSTFPESNESSKPIISEPIIRESTESQSRPISQELPAHVTDGHLPEPPKIATESNAFPESNESFKPIIAEPAVRESTESQSGPISQEPPAHLTDGHLPEPPKIATKSGTFSESNESSKPITPEPSVHESTESQSRPISQEPVNRESTSHENESFPFITALKTIENKSDPCGGRYIYVHDLPSRFNEDMLKECRSLSRWTNMCKLMTNAGLGPPLHNVEGVFSNTGWYATNQFAVDVIFNNRMKQYECLTRDSSIAAAIFVPFYAGFDIARYLWGYNISMRDAASLDLVDWLMKRPEWGIMQGRDHFLVAGRITWDFRRLTEEEYDWGNKLLFLPAAKNMSMLVVESSPWNANDFGIPYPTYFHPAKDADVFDWQNRMRKLDRKWLFSFAGAPRPGNPKSIRGQIIDQCRNSEVCKLLECDFGENKCHSPSSIMQMFQSSLFCLQPQGDSYTRRSAFDSMLAGCIPVFFHPGSAYTQYTWHLPKNYSTYSLFIPEDDIRKRNVSIEERLKQISSEQVHSMRETVINLIPRLIYADPRSKLETLKDSFDVAVQSIIDKVTSLRRNIIEGRTEYDNFVEQNSWKYALLDEGLRSVGAHEWDPFFSKPKDNEGDSSGSSAEAAKNSWRNEQRAHS